MIPVQVVQDSSAELVREDSGGFRVFSPGSMGELVTGFRFVIAGPRLAAFLRENCPQDIELEPTFVFRQATGERWEQYSEVRLSRGLLAENVPLLESDPGTAWHMDFGNLFLHPEVAELLKASDLELDLDFDFVMV